MCQFSTAPILCPCTVVTISRVNIKDRYRNTNHRHGTIILKFIKTHLTKGLTVATSFVAIGGRLDLHRYTPCTFAVGGVLSIYVPAANMFAGFWSILYFIYCEKINYIN